MLRVGTSQGDDAGRARHARAPGKIRGGKDTPHLDARAGELPTAMLAVRRCRRRWSPSPTDAPVCPRESLDVPVLAPAAALVTVRDGRLLARIEEARQIMIPAHAEMEIEAVVPVENEETVKALRQYADAVSHGQWGSAPPTLPYWLQSDVRCKNGEEGGEGHVGSESESCGTWHRGSTCCAA